MTERQFTIRVFGKVQGVWFRKSTKEAADRLGVRGIVYNEPDGSVYIVARGRENQMKEFLQFCKNGPENAKVENILVDEDELKEFKGFEII